MQKKTRSRMPPRKKDVGNYYMSYKWAIPTWNFFHSFASKINADFYAANRTTCLKIITDIGRTLPCQQCQTHANAFFTPARLSGATTKKNFIKLLLDFHNDVNQRTGKPLLTLDNLKKYSCAHFINISRVFLSCFSGYQTTMHGGLSDRRARMNIIHYTRNWINIYYRNFI